MDFVNKGTALINDKVPYINEKQATAVVFGVARSGTSMITMILRELGVHMGEELSNAVLEDHSVFTKLEGTPELESFSKLVEERNAKYDVWGWKRPEAVKYVDLFEPLIRNPKYIITFRDILAIAMRNSISVNANLKRNLIKTHKNGYRRIIQLIEETTVPSLLISYEKALNNKENVVYNIIDFLKINPNQDQIRNAINSIEPNRKEYIANTLAPAVNPEKFVGNIDYCRDGKVHGWAKQKSSKKPIELNIYVDDILIQKVSASMYREDLKKSGLGEGNHGFDSDISSLIESNNQEKILRVEVIGNDFSLKKSPLKFIY